MSLIKTIRQQLGLSVTPANNFTLDASADNGTMKLARGNAGATTQDIMLVSAAGVVTFPNNPVVAQGAQIVLDTAKSATGTAVDFTGIPSWAKRITVMFTGVSTNGASLPQIQLGDSGGVETSGYLCSAGTIASASAAAVNATTGFVLNRSDAASVIHGSMTINLIDASTNTWSSMGVFGLSNSTFVLVTGGSKSLSATLDRVRITTVNGTDAFDAGSINILYEG